MHNCTEGTTFIIQFLKSRVNYLWLLGQPPPAVKYCGCAPVYQSPTALTCSHLSRNSSPCITHFLNTLCFSFVV
jgi:hypothetical protein